MNPALALVMRREAIGEKRLLPVHGQKAKTQEGTLWMALAIWAPTRLWMGGVVNPIAGN